MAEKHDRAKARIEKILATGEHAGNNDVRTVLRLLDGEYITKNEASSYLSQFSAWTLADTLIEAVLRNDEFYLTSTLEGL